MFHAQLSQKNFTAQNSLRFMRNNSAKVCKKKICATDLAISWKPYPLSKCFNTIPWCPTVKMIVYWNLFRHLIENIIYSYNINVREMWSAFHTRLKNLWKFKNLFQSVIYYLTESTLSSFREKMRNVAKKFAKYECKFSRNVSFAETLIGIYGV